MTTQTLADSIAELRDKLSVIESQALSEKGALSTLIGKGIDTLAHSGGGKMLPPKIPTKGNWMSDLPEPAGGGRNLPARMGANQNLPSAGGSGGKIPPSGRTSAADAMPELPPPGGGNMPSPYTHNGEFIGKDVPKDLPYNRSGQTIDGEFRTVGPEKGGMPSPSGSKMPEYDPFIDAKSAKDIPSGAGNSTKGLPSPKGSDMPEYDPFANPKGNIPSRAAGSASPSGSASSASNNAPYGFPVPDNSLPHNSTPIGRGNTPSSNRPSSTSGTSSTSGATIPHAPIGSGGASSAAGGIPGISARPPNGGSSLWGAAGLAGALAGGAGGYALGKHADDGASTQPTHQPTKHSGHKGHGHTQGRRGNPEIAKWQELLNANGANIKVDGVYGPETQAAYDKIFPKFQKEQTMAESIRDLRFKLDIL